MAKIPKTATELKDIILERIGVKVTVLPLNHLDGLPSRLRPLPTRPQTNMSWIGS